MSVSDWSATADENTTVDGINIAEHCPAKNINNAIRSVMAALKNKCDALDSTDNTLRRGAVIGEIRWFAMSTPPEGWLACNGAAVGTSDYPALFAAIGKTFTPRYLDESLKIEDPRYSDPDIFLLPNLMGKVPWGSTSVGTVIDAGLPNTKGTIAIDLPGGIAPFENSGYGALFNNYSAKSYTSYRSSGDSVTRSSDSFLRFDASRFNSIYGNSDTVQPPALCLLPCIRYE